MARASNTEQRRAQIAEALLSVMARRGYEGASIIAIAKQARLAAGVVHYHFENKLEILVAAVGLLTSRHLAVLDAALAAVEAPPAQVAAFIDVHLGLGAHADPGALACWVLIGAEALRERRVQVELERALAAIAARLAAIIERGVAERSFERVDAAACAAALVALVQGYFAVAATARGVIPSGTAASCALRMAEGLFAARPAARDRTEAAMTVGKATLARFGLLGLLYFAQGLPFGYFTQAVPVLLRTEGYSLGKIGVASLLAVPWALKFLWAPVVDRRWWPRVGRRRSWILPMQLAGTLVLAGLAFAPAADSVGVVMAAMLVLNLIAATQDVATDGLAVDLLPPAERGLANGLQVAGYRLGMIIGGGVLLGLHDELGTRGIFAAMAVLTALGSVPVFAMREPPVASPAQAQHTPVHFLRRPGAWRLLGLIAIYKAGEGFASGMLRPFLVDLGRSLSDIGWMIGTVGSVAGMLGALVGGALVSRLGRRRALVAFGVGQVVTVAGYAYLAVTEPSVPALYAWCGLEHFASGMATAALFTCMMDWSVADRGATDYTVQASTVVIATGLASTLSGLSAGALGYAAHFALAAVLCVAAVIVAAALFPREPAVVR